MLHARQDYNRRIQDSEGLIPGNEPVFLIRGHDPTLPLILELYANVTARTPGHDPVIVSSVRQHIERVKAWQAAMGTKEPDMDPADVVA